MLDCSALKTLNTLCSGVCTPPKARVDAVDNGTSVELISEKVNTLLNLPENIRVIRQAWCYAISGESQCQSIGFSFGVKGLHLL